VLLVDPLARPVIAHRGNRAHSPENTLFAFRQAVDLGAEALELDVHLTADGEVVVCHDPTVDRTTDGSGAISHKTLAEILELDAGARWSPHADPEVANGGIATGPRPFAARGVRIPTLADVLGIFPGTPIIVEAKSVAVGGPLTTLVQRMGAADRVLIGSFHHDALTPARSGGLNTTASRAELLRALPSAILKRRMRDIPFDAVAIPPTHRGLPVPIAGFMAAFRCPMHIWTVNDPDHARRLWEAGVNGIITDDPALMLRTDRLAMNQEQA